EWFDCACCPPNLARLIASIGSYFYSTSGDTLFVHLYNQNRSTLTVGGTTVRLAQQTNYPWDEQVEMTVGVDAPARFKMALRIPEWCRSYTLSVNGAAVQAAAARGYVTIEREWANGDTVTLRLAMPVERMAPHPEIRQDAGCVALQRGPVVYCLEQVDNGPRLANVALPREA
ncbi:MAG: glycoside hydrolase family 127 protein, partial [Anaerolineae bacterium]|nr:glycoside hydrolase family 127 protein [Anaerolineae bacterium]